MSPIRQPRWLLVYQWLAGVCDVSTGMFLIFAPSWTLLQMGVKRPPQSIEFAGFIGAFVLSVGVAYLYAARLPMNAADAPRWQTVWWLTAMSRTLVASFLMWKIHCGPDGDGLVDRGVDGWRPGDFPVERFTRGVVAFQRLNHAFPS